MNADGRVGHRHRAVAVLVHWGDPQPTLRLAAMYAKQPVFDHVVVMANDRRAAARNEPGVSWVVPERNLGYGAACQRAADMFDADYYAFLNPDVVLLGDAAARCLDALENAGLSIAGPVLVHGDGRLQSGCGTWSRILRAPVVLTWPSTAVAKCEWITGAAMFCRREVMTDVRFDGSYFLGGEDADLCDRVRELGWEVGIVKEARGVHEGKTSITEGRWQYYSLRNRVWLARKRHSRRVALVNYLWLAGAMVPRIMCADVLKRRGFALSRAALRSLVDAAAPLPTFGQPWPHEPVPQAWLAW